MEYVTCGSCTRLMEAEDVHVRASVLGISFFFLRRKLLGTFLENIQLQRAMDSFAMARREYAEITKWPRDNTKSIFNTR